MATSTAIPTRSEGCPRRTIQRRSRVSVCLARDPRCKETLRIFVTALAGHLRQTALHILPTGGLFLCGEFATIVPLLKEMLAPGPLFKTPSWANSLREYTAVDHFERRCGVAGSEGASGKAVARVSLLALRVCLTPCGSPIPSTIPSSLRTECVLECRAAAWLWSNPSVVRPAAC